jgi:predicted Zn-dependent protease
MSYRPHLPFALVVALVVGGLVGCHDPGQTEIARGNVLTSRQQFDEALEAYRAAERVAPRKSRPRELRGHVLFHLRRFPEAREAYAEAVALEPESALEARIGLARIDAEEGKLDQALEGVSGLLAQQPDNLYALLSRANLAIRRGKPGDAQLAVEDTAKAMSLQPGAASVLYTRGCAFLAAGQPGEAKGAFDLLEKEHAGSPLAPYGRAKLAATQADKAAVLVNLRAAKAKAGDLAGGWEVAQVRTDPAFRFLAEDPEFKSLVEG